MFCNLIGIVSGLLRCLNLNSLYNRNFVKWFWSCTDHHFSDLFFRKILKLVGSPVGTTSFCSRQTQYFYKSLKNPAKNLNFWTDRVKSQISPKIFPVFHQIEFILSVAFPCVGIVSGLFCGFLRIHHPPRFLIFDHHTNEQISEGGFHVIKSGSV